MINSIEKALEETWKMKEVFYEDNKNLSTIEILTKLDNKYGKSPLEDIPCITANITTQGLVELIRESRAGV